MKFNSKIKLKHKKNNEAFVAHFRLLGLRRGECRSNVIRSAAQAMAVALKRTGTAFAEDNLASEQYAGGQTLQTADDVRRARIAIATYRLLDPRERTDNYERVQLCYPIDRDDSDSPAVSTRKLVDQMPKVLSDDESVLATTIHSLDQLSSGQSLEERRSIVRLMRETNESTLRGLSPLGWLKSRLGI